MTACAQGYGYTPEEVVPLGSLPALRQLHLSDCLEGDPGPYASRASRFVESASLQSLQVCPAVLCLPGCSVHAGRVHATQQRQLPQAPAPRAFVRLASSAESAEGLPPCRPGSCMKGSHAHTLLLTASMTDH